MTASRRQFVLSAVAGLGASSLALAKPSKVKLKKAVKFAMIKGGGILERFELAKKCGFAGVEADSPGPYLCYEMREASRKTGVVIHGVIDSVHWAKPLSDPKPEVRVEGLKALETAMRDTHFFGADTCLLVPGVVKDGTSFDECWERSTAEVKKLLRLAEELKVKIAIEVVWNNFLTTPELLIKYVDQFNSPWVGAYFDASNMIKYGVPSAEWIRKLGKRMLKMDFKGYHYDKKKWVGIGEGTENWPEVLKACEEVGYDTWATAEVSGGGEEVLLDISKKMDAILELN